jgi:hypothetical protein
MAGERFAKITIQASFATYPRTRGEQAREVSLKLAGQWAVFRLGGNPAQYEFALPDANSQDLHAYMLDGITNLIAVIRAYIKDKSLPYTVSDVRYVGDNPANLEQPIVEFDVEATTYYKVNDLEFTYPSYAPTAWWIKSLVTTIQPVIVTYDKVDTTIFGSANGSISIHASNGTSGYYTYLWDDLGPFGGPAERTNLVAGKYRVKVLDDGAYTTLNIVIGSDAKLEVAVSATQDSIELKASGGRPGYTYVWRDGPTGPVRINLADGTYYCHVTDSIGAVCDVEVTLTPYRYYWSRNAITLDLDAGQDYRDDPSSKPNLSFLCEVWLEKEYGTGDFEQVGITLEQPADRNGRTTFEVQALLNVYLQHHVPAPDATDVERANSLFRRFYLKHAQQFGEVPTPAPSATLDRNYVVLGGLNFYEAQARTWFTSYQPQQLPFLTWEPATKWVLADQPEFLYYMAQDASAFRTQVRVHFSDGGQSLVEYTGADEVSKFEIFCLPCGYKALGLAKLNDQGRQVVSWEVFVATPGGAKVLSETRDFHLHTRFYPRRRYLLFATSLGGMATYVAVGDAQTDLELTGAESAITPKPTYDPLLGDTVVQDRTMRPVVKIAGSVRTRAQLEVSKDLLLSKRVLLLNATATRWLPGYIKTKTANLLDESKLVLTQEFDFYLTTEHVYSPDL